MEVENLKLFEKKSKQAIRRYLTIFLSRVSASMIIPPFLNF